MASLNLDLIFPDVFSLKLIGIMDMSFYPNTFTVNTPAIEITPPGFNRVVSSFSPGTLNLYNSSNLNITCIDEGCGLADLPDGIWMIKYSIAPSSVNFVEKTFLRVTALKAKFESAFMATDMKQCDTQIKAQDMETIDQIEFFIQGAISEANRCNNIAAMKRYNAASKLIDNFLKTK